MPPPEPASKMMTLLPSPSRSETSEWRIVAHPRLLVGVCHVHSIVTTNMSHAEDDLNPLPEGEGATIWSKVAGAASTLTVSVSKAWAVNIPMLAGEGQLLAHPFSTLPHSICSQKLQKGEKPDLRRLSERIIWLKHRTRPTYPIGCSSQMSESP